MHYAYIIENPKGRRYIGCTSDLKQRLENHNTGISTWTRHRGPWKLIWSKECETLSDARKLENLLKRQGRGGRFLSYNGIKQIRLIIRPLPDPWFKSKPRYQFERLE